MKRFISVNGECEVAGDVLLEDAGDSREAVDVLFDVPTGFQLEMFQSVPADALGQRLRESIAQPLRFWNFRVFQRVGHANRVPSRHPSSGLGRKQLSRGKSRQVL